MPFSLDPSEIIETVQMLEMQNLDIRTITMGVSLRDCRGDHCAQIKSRIHDKLIRTAGNLVKVGEDIEKEYGIPIINKRISVTPISIVADGCSVEEMEEIGEVIDQAGAEIGVNFIGGFTALVHKGMTRGDEALIHAIPGMMARTERVCSSVNVGTTRAGINMDAVALMGRIIKETAERTASRDGIGCARLVVFCNVPEDNPFMAGAFHGVGEPEATINIGISGPGVVLNVVRRMAGADFGTLANEIKNTAFKITRMGELVGRVASKRLNVPFGIVDLSLAPTPAAGDSVADILEAIGVERTGAPGTTAALAMLNDAVKKGGAMASSYVGGLSGAFIPVSEDAGMVRAVVDGSLTLEKLEAMTCVCSVGLDMIAIPGDISAETIAAIIADEAAIGMINHKTTGVRIIPVPGKKEGDWVEFGGLLGAAPIMAVNRFDSSVLIRRGGRIPAPIHALNN
ncbi:MAG: PFL family protein [Solirubrobacterales bacterium]